MTSYNSTIYKTNDPTVDQVGVTEPGQRSVVSRLRAAARPA